jgi:two-component system OmpR family response regulator
MSATNRAVTFRREDAAGPIRFASAKREGQHRVMVVDGDRATQKVLPEAIQDHGMRVLLASGLRDMMRYLPSAKPSVVILSLQGHQAGGLASLREIKSRYPAPAIMAVGDSFGQVEALESGADDYVIKPLAIREVIARIRAILRRFPASPRRPRTKWDCCRFGNWELDPRARSLTSSTGSRFTLTNAECNLLATFINAPQRLLTREHLLNATHLHADINGRSIDVLMVRLRRKLQAASGAPPIIRTERGVGYTFALPVHFGPAQGPLACSTGEIEPHGHR